MTTELTSAEQRHWSFSKLCHIFGSLHHYNWGICTCVDTACISYTPSVSFIKSMASHRTACGKCMKFGTQMENSLNIAPPTVQSCTRVYFLVHFLIRLHSMILFSIMKIFLPFRIFVNAYFFKFVLGSLFDFRQNWLRSYLDLAG